MAEQATDDNRQCYSTACASESEMSYFESCIPQTPSKPGNQDHTANLRQDSQQKQAQEQQRCSPGTGAESNFDIWRITKHTRANPPQVLPKEWLGTLEFKGNGGEQLQPLHERPVAPTRNLWASAPDIKGNWMEHVAGRKVWERIMSTLPMLCWIPIAPTLCFAWPTSSLRLKPAMPALPHCQPARPSTKKTTLTHGRVRTYWCMFTLSHTTSVSRLESDDDSNTQTLAEPANLRSTILSI